LRPGDIFIPVKGARFDGHDFIAEARRKGASQILDVDLGQFAAAHRLKHNIPVIAITGSSGKTTTKDLLAAALGQKFNLIKSAENQNNEIGVPLTLLKIEKRTELAVVEMAMRGAGQIEYLAKIAQPTHAVITNIGWTHVELLGSRDNIAQAKAEVIQPDMTIFLNENDDYYVYLSKIADARNARVIGYKSAKILDSNKAAVTAVARHFGLTDEQIAAGLAQSQSSPHRQKIIRRNGLTLIDDTYNANPDSLNFALQVLRETPAARRVAVLGDMLELGSRAEKLHQQIDVTGLDIVYTYGQLSANIPQQEHFTDKAALAQKLKEILRPGDVVLCKGSRGLQMETIVQDLLAAGDNPN
ncbi:MAG: UDP-N-acetylmuramoyl-tripeptide--D-alanyl-D-alanine ligase, partial [Candidatus Margulisbacteria bacterium]|jgi:UDP-N-acetylmuramoyl-tripeptide--D-alanyl-D-alanine ligase|nr:UDP-N-acetylmuramoyl-tripeptide--D-alanyl-D-alanine ligase [Candidatus Margulisiibacteriota bacterium]